ncbi:winged helix-turn-helix transcriptional regulator [Streptomyces chartreusis]|uniref:winged helix-turn-helix transcriptional regulator n=1 Tax=Streptomyces chartreusis TaxID=1969 RepID=UPI003D8CFBFF
MDAISFPVNASCPIAHALDVLGDKWTLLILREALSGKTRFAEFREIGIPREVLSQRLNRLQEYGLLAKRPYKEAGARVRDEYVLTAEGQDVNVVLAALCKWGQQHRPDRELAEIEFVDRDTGNLLSLDFRDDRGHIGASRVALVRK